ncbi:hypothetical protein GGR58DRAFT_483192 [Xylaria digitata]|nr:hypothetical protein GGR58DRAFT_483192 [Xylaria digitata]
MASPRRPGLLTNPYQLATLLLGIAFCFLAATTIPPSSTIYLIRADYGINDRDGITSTAWFNSLGYCKADSNNDVLTHTLSDIRCSHPVIGYNAEAAIEQDGTTMVSLSHAPTLSILLTRGLYVLILVAYALCLVGMAAHQAILRRPTAMRYAVSVGSSLLALLSSGIAFLFENSLRSYIASGVPTTAGVTFKTSNGPLVYAFMLALLFQLAACTVGFYSCIGGKYQCEGGIRLEDEEKSASGVSMSRSTSEQYSLLDEKQSLYN